jgi:hypothetical protein
MARILLKKTLNNLKDLYSKALLKLRDIYNIKTDFKVLFNHGLSFIQVILTKLNNKDR